MIDIKLNKLELEDACKRLNDNSFIIIFNMMFRHSGDIFSISSLGILVVLLAASLGSVLSVFDYPADQNYVSAQQTVMVNITVGASVPGSQAPGITPYQPAAIEIPHNSKVIWRNLDSSFHTVTSGNSLSGPTREFDSGILPPGKEFPHIFTVPAQYNYYCTVHPFMSGVIFVKLS